MASPMKKGNKISQIVRLKQVMQRWKTMSIKRRCDVVSDSSSDSDNTTTGHSNRKIPSGSLAVYVSVTRRRFVIPTRFLNLPVFVSLLNQAEEEFGFRSNGGLVFLCEVPFFKKLLKVLERDEQGFGGLGLDDFLNMFADVDIDSSCKDATNSCHSVTPLLQKTRV